MESEKTGCPNVSQVQIGLLGQGTEEKGGMMELQIEVFNYDELTVENREFVKQKETAIKARTAQTVIENGRDLLEVKERLEHGQFVEWVEICFGMSKQRASEYMRIASEFKGPPGGLLDQFHKKALILLSSPSTPEEARTEAIERAEAGEKITHADAKELVEAHKQIAAERKLIGTLEKQIKELQSQIPTEDVKSQIQELKSQLFDAQNKPPEVRPPEDYQQAKDEAVRLRDELEKKKESIDRIESQKEKAIRDGISSGRAEIEDELRLKRRDVKNLEERINRLRESKALWEKRANNSQWIEENRKKIESALLNISIAMRDLFEDCDITDEARPGLVRLCNDMKQGAQFFENLLNGGFIDEKPTDAQE